MNLQKINNMRRAIREMIHTSVYEAADPVTDAKKGAKNKLEASLKKMDFLMGHISKVEPEKVEKIHKILRNEIVSSLKAIKDLD